MSLPGTHVAPPTRFVLVRHGEASGNRELRYLGTTDVPLTERGQAQALQLAEAVRPFALAAIYTSPLRRAADTAARVASGPDLTPQIEADLREEDFGAWENLTRAEVLARDPEHLSAWEAGAEVAPPGGESLAQVRARMISCANRLAARHPAQTVALLSHVGPIKALVCAALDLPPRGAQRMWLDPAGVCVVDWRLDDAGAGSGMLRVFNSVAHLDPPARWLVR
jgi:broad specificity phosphatase PhoE